MSEPILKVENMNKKFGSTVALMMYRFRCIREKSEDLSERMDQENLQLLL